MFGKIQKLQRYVFGAVIGLAVLSFLVTWFFAPEAGGNWWPYIRFSASVLVSLIVTWISFTIFSYILVVKFANDIRENGNRGNVWSEKEVDQFMNNFEHSDSEDSE